MQPAPLSGSGRGRGGSRGRGYRGRGRGGPHRGRGRGGPHRGRGRGGGEMRHEEAVPRRVLYAAIRMQSPADIIALVPPELVAGKAVQSELHVTVRYFGNEVDPVAIAQLAELVGTPIDVTLTRVVSDAKGTAIAVRNDNEFPCANASPHVTIANAPGVPAKYSNELLSPAHDGDPNRTVVPLPDGTTAKGVFVFVPR